jgi:histidinol-phosphate aminotransferase
MSHEGPRPIDALAGVRAYAIPRHPAPCDLRLDGNEGPLPPERLVAELAAQADAREMVRRYPDARSLEERLALRHGVDGAQVLVTAGGDDALDRACRAFLAPGREIVMPVPTFEMLARYAALAGATIREVPWGPEAYPIEAVLGAVTERTAAVAVVSPNNPTGAVATAEDVRRIAAAVPRALVIVDCAYAEYADEDLTGAALACPNAVVVRSLSKAWGLAGLRVGYAVGPLATVALLRAAGHPYPVAAPSLALAGHALEVEDGRVERAVARVRLERTALRERLAARGVEAWPSQANFVFARTPGVRWLADGLAGLGIAVRTFPGHRLLDGSVRITCPCDERAFERLAAGLDAVLAPEALLFDLDGVLADVSASYRRAIVETARSFGVEVAGADIAAAKAAGDANNDWKLTRALLAARGVDAPLDEVTARFEALYEGGLWKSESLLCDPDFLARLSRRLPIAVVTGRPRAQAERFYELAGIAGRVSASVCMEDAPQKPDPAPVRLVLERLGVARAWLVGDTPDDVRAARAAGVVPIGFTREDIAPSLLAAGAARVLASLAEIEELLP